MGSEMCIRDRNMAAARPAFRAKIDQPVGCLDDIEIVLDDHHGIACLLYTSDAADERSSVDLGGRRIIKKKKKVT